nr:ABC transporter ATP-binding protein [Massilistercora timonensis]
MSTVEVKELKKSYGSVQSVRGVSLDISDGEFIAFLGSSGCGKTTTLRMIAGLINQDSGEIFIDGKNVDNVKPWKRDIGFVFQNYALFPHLTAFDNIAYGLKLRKWSKKEIDTQVRKIAGLVEIGQLLNRYPKQMSGGQQQRVALARALAINPKVLLLDEPLSGLDAKLRERMQYELRVMQRAANITSIYVTHDQNEAFALADRVVVMHEGKVVQVGKPEEIYSKPQSEFVAKFIGVSSDFQCVVKENKESGAVLQFGEYLIDAAYRPGISPGETVTAVIRTNVVELSKEPVVGQWSIPCRIISNTLNGTHWRISVDIDGVEFKADLNNTSDKSIYVGWTPGENAYYTAKPENVWFFNK